MPGTALHKFKYFITLILGTYIYEKFAKGNTGWPFDLCKKI